MSEERLDRIERLVEVISQKVESNTEAIADLTRKVVVNEAENRAILERLDAEVRRWDERFFKFAEDTANRANTLIASATIAVIAGVLLLVLRQ